MFFRELQRIQCPDRLFHIAANRKIIDHLVAHHTGPVNQEQPAQRNGIIQQHVIRPGDLLVQVRHQRETDFPDAPFVHRRLPPGKVSVLGIHRHPQDHRIFVGKPLDRLVKGQNLGRADKREIKRVEEQDHIFPPIRR